MNCFWGMVDRRRAFSFISSRDHCQRHWPSLAGFEPAQNLSSEFVEWSCAVVIITTPQRTYFQHSNSNLIMTMSFTGIYNTSHKLLRPSQFLEKFMKILKWWKNSELCRNKLGPFPLLNLAAYWKSSNSEACAKKLSQILANNIDTGGRGFGLRIYVRYCLKK